MPEASMTSQECKEIRDELHSLDKRMEVHTNTVQMLADTIKAFMSRDRAADCPLRIEIARAANNTARIATVETRMHEMAGKVHDVELLTVKAATRGGAIGGGGVGALVLIGYGIAKAIGLA